jgi:cell division protein FtsL
MNKANNKRIGNIITRGFKIVRISLTALSESAIYVIDTNHKLRSLAVETNVV